MNRRRFLYTLAAGAGACVGGGVYARYGEPHWLRVERVRIPLGANQGGRPITLLQMSDFHASPYVSLAFIEEAVALGLKNRPDLVCLTGDFVTGRLEDADRYAKILRRLSDAAPTFACLGNHDGGVWSARHFHGHGDTAAVEALLAEARVTCLVNTARSISIAGRPLELVGMGDLWAGNLKPDEAFASGASPDGAVRVVLSHNPDSKTRLASHPWDLMLCGHTHGGQVWISFVGSPFLPVSDRRFAMGLHRWQDRWIYVTRGIGNLYGIRFNCRPEVSLLTVA